METGQYIVVKVTPDQRAYTYWVVDPPVGLALHANGLPVEPPQVFPHRTVSAATLAAAIEAEMPVLISAPVIVPPSSIEIASSLAGGGTIAIGARLSAAAASQVGGVGELSAAENLLGAIAATVSGTGSITAQGSLIQPIRATMAGVGSLTAWVDTGGTKDISTTLSGVGSVVADATFIGVIESLMAGAGGVSANTNLAEAIRLSVAGSGSLTADLLSHPGSISISSSINGSGTLSIDALSGTIFYGAASVSGNDVTVTAKTTVNLTAASKVFGVEWGDGPSGVYNYSKNISGQASDQSITIGLLDGVIPGHTISYRPYYNLTAGDPYNTRVYERARTQDVPQSSVNIVANLSGTGSISANVLFGTLFNVDATESLGSVTVTAKSAVSLTNARYGVEYGDGAGGVYTKSKNIVGAAKNQSITIGPLDDVVAGHTLSYRPYANFTESDPYTTRVYGESKTISVP